ncbi:hypothetical protein CKA32_003753 [Geitlerinema sp. FC II]|nr:hypothetical protein CKA32_003753 [Geitlerinema sp. FC II]
MDIGIFAIECICHLKEYSAISFEFSDYFNGYFIKIKKA